jgi:hypothetical protein
MRLAAIPRMLSRRHSPYTPRKAATRQTTPDERKTSGMYLAPMRPPASTIHSWPPPPAPGSVAPSEPELGPIMTCPPPASTPSTEVVKTSGILALHKVVTDAAREPASPTPMRPSLSQTAGICASMLGATLRAEAVIIHVHDPRSGQLRVIGADGAGALDLLGAIHYADDDVLASALVTTGEPLMQIGGEPLRRAPPRLRRFAGAPSYLAVPIMTSRGCIAIVEVIGFDDTLRPVALDTCQRAGETLLRCRQQQMRPRSSS